MAVKFWNVVEEQRFDDGKVATLSTPKENYNEAESAYYSILASAAISTIPYHAAYILESNRGVVMCKFYDRSVDNG